MIDRNDLQELNIAVLMGGSSREREVSLASGAAVLDALRTGGYQVRAIDATGEAWWNQLADIDLAFNSLHGPGGEGGVVQGLLDTMGIVGTGSNVLGSTLALDKPRSKLLWQALNLPTPSFELVEDPSALESLLDRWGSLFLKPAFEGSSIGVSQVSEVGQIEAAWDRASSCKGPVMAEAFVDGPEYTVTILGDRTLPPIRISSQEQFYDYAAKYELDTTRYHIPCGLADSKEQELCDLALAAFQALGCEVWGRVDVMATEADQALQLLEVNTIPGMTGHSLVPKAAAAAGLSFLELVEEVLRLSWNNRGREEES
ncbi:MAG: D-alanine--D-alanine ligase [Pseudomonadota bacterium]